MQHSEPITIKRAMNNNQGWCDIYGVQYTARNTARCSTIFWLVYCKIERGQFKFHEIPILTYLALYKSIKKSIFYVVFQSFLPISLQKKTVFRRNFHSETNKSRFSNRNNRISSQITIGIKHFVNFAVFRWILKNSMR